MTLFWFALALFLLTHIVPAVPAVRGAVVGVIGDRIYRVLYSLVSIMLLALLVYATLQLGYVPLWYPQPWQAWITLVLAPIGLFLLLAGMFSRNPLSISVRRAEPPPGAIAEITRDPVLWGFMLWSASHLLPNGELRALLLFGTLFVFALVGIPLAERRAKRRLGKDWPSIAGGTSILPFGAIASRRTILRIDPIMGFALVLTILLTIWLLGGGHTALFGADQLALALT